MPAAPVPAALMTTGPLIVPVPDNVGELLPELPPTVTLLPVANEPVMRSVPALTRVGPVQVLVVESTSAPVPSFVSPRAFAPALVFVIAPA